MRPARRRPDVDMALLQRLAEPVQQRVLDERLQAEFRDERVAQLVADVVTQVDAVSESPF